MKATTLLTPTESPDILPRFHGDLDSQIKVKLKIPLFQQAQMLERPAPWRGLKQPPSPVTH